MTLNTKARTLKTAPGGVHSCTALSLCWRGKRSGILRMNTFDRGRTRAVVVGLVLAASGAAAQTDDGTDAVAPLCELKGANGMVAMLLCPEDLSEQAYADEGRIACDGRAPCGAWIWTDAAVIPDEAPDAHDKLPPESVRAAVAIWLNDNAQLMMLEQASSD